MVNKLDQSTLFKTAACPVCGSAKAKKQYRINYGTNVVLDKIEYTGSYPESFLVKCSSCAHYYADLILSEEAFRAYYQKNSIFYNEQSKNKNELVDRNPSKHEKIVSLIERHVSTGKVMEIGCGLGHLLLDLKERNWDVYGVEPGAFASNYAREKLNLNVITGFLTHETYEDNSFDVIIMNDVIEHLPDSQEMMKLIHAKLKPGGFVVLGTGNVESLNAKLNRTTWQYFANREHVSFFSAKSIQALLKRFEFETAELQKISHKGSSGTNTVKLIENMLFRKPVNMVLPLALQIFPALKNWSRIKHRSCAQTGVISSNLTFDHILVIGQKKNT